ncbi:DUF6653 family protein [Mycobacteroides saopaulense]|uniref:Uncharacterized protein n=1 Tax=Mycobacteroides saopaulense TaxID=1578165 RepID=A0ABX3BU96_9MYCO|nr:DUF6653 family protein [Mycobacteroides saopaulense]OHT87640.1 hypothetical protein BKG68_06285 [Mycobacteroides saopaulense]OHU05984.1 hypothetical protein BKG73_20430 [Mycobacteroides saopaulense]
MNGEAVRRWIFARHCHPVSAWSRWATTPLLLVPVWTRRWRWAIPIGVWLAINPVVTPPPRDDRSFATRAIRGEEIWMTKPTSDAMLTGLSILGGAALVSAFVAAWRRSCVGVTVGTAISMAITLLAWRRYDQIWRSVRPRR